MNLSGQEQRILFDKAGVLIEALPYIQRFSGKIVVVKYGGNAISDSEETLSEFVKDVVLLHLVGLKPVVVHGGGPQIDQVLNQIGHSSSFVNGLRVTDAQTLEAVKMVLLGQVNPLLVSRVNLHGDLGVGISGVDASMIVCRQHSKEHGFVGDIVSTNPDLVVRLLKEGLIPIVASIGVDRFGQMYNVNADLVASSLAGALRAEKLIFLTNIEGIMEDPDDQSSLIRKISAPDLEATLTSGVISGGMIPKVKAALHAIESGVGSVHMLDGRLEHSLLLEVFTDQGIGTMIYG